MHYFLKFIKTLHVSDSSSDGQRNCPKHVEIYFKNKFEKLINLVRFIIGIHISSFCVEAFYIYYKRSVETCSHFYPDEEGSFFFRNFGKYLQDYVVLSSRKTQSLSNDTKEVAIKIQLSTFFRFCFS